MAERLKEKEAAQAAGDLGRLIAALEPVMRGKRRFLEDLVAGFAAEGHVLIEDAPGLGKTTAAKALARAVAKEGRGGKPGYSRIQFTPDLLPYDITGVEVYDPERGSFSFRKGPVFAEVVLADEVNRTTPKVQSALLEAMAERQVTVGNTTHAMGDLFFVIATQNPVETEGTYPLPAAQLDRFLLKLSIGYPDAEAERSIYRDDPSANFLGAVKPALPRARLLAAMDAARRVACSDEAEEAVLDIVQATRKRKDILLGASPRGGLMLIKAARARALVQGRSFVDEQDIADMAAPALAHRLVLADPRADAAALVAEIARERLAKRRR